MKKDLHPNINVVEAVCTCGYTFNTTSTDKSLHTTLCSQCHPFYTGTQKYVDTAGRIEKFEKKFKKNKA